MAETGQAPQRPAAKSPLMVRVALFVTLALVIICVVLWFFLKSDLDRAIALYDAGEYQEAVHILQPLIDRPLARLRIRQAAERTLGFCKAELATQVAMKERSAEGYRKALQLLAEAKELAGPTPEIEKGIKEYTEYLQKLEPPPTPPAPLSAPPKTPPTTAPNAPTASPPS